MGDEVAFIAPRYFERVAEIYKTVAANDGAEYAVNIKSPYRAAEYLKYAPLLRQHLGDAAADVLDWGALWGHVSVMVEEMGYRPTPFILSDISSPWRSPLQSQFGGRYVVHDDPVTLPFDDGRFNAVISSGVFEHVPEVGGSFSGSLREIRRVLRPGGYFFLWKLPHASGLAEMKSDLFGRWSHPFRFTPAGIRIMLEHAGFEVVHLDYDGLAPEGVRSRLRRYHMTPLLKLGARMARAWPFRVFANDLTVVARKRA